MAAAAAAAAAAAPLLHGTLTKTLCCCIHLTGFIAGRGTWPRAQEGLPEASELPKKTSGSRAYLSRGSRVEFNFSFRVTIFGVFMCPSLSSSSSVHFNPLLFSAAAAAAAATIATTTIAAWRSVSYVCMCVCMKHWKIEWVWVDVKTQRANPINDTLFRERG